MAVSYQMVIDCMSPEPLAHFWAEALHYVIAPPPPGFDSWDAFYRSIGVPEAELGTGTDSIEDPNGEGSRIWFQIVPEKKSIKNRVHIDVNASGGDGTAWNHGGQDDPGIPSPGTPVVYACTTYDGGDGPVQVGVNYDHGCVVVCRRVRG
jgi:Glyoxalase-like domain